MEEMFRYDREKFPPAGQPARVRLLQDSKSVYMTANKKFSDAVSFIRERLYARPTMTSIRVIRP
jgi:hypothetical protein